MSKEYPDAGQGLEFLAGTGWALHCPGCQQEWGIFWPADGRRPILMKEAVPEPEEPYVPEPPSEFDKAMDKLGWSLNQTIDNLVNDKGLDSERTIAIIQEALKGAQDRVFRVQIQVKEEE